MEANLDTQWIMAVSQSSPTYYIYDDASDFLLTWATNLAAMKSPPLIQSISYGATEAFLTQSYVDAVDVQLIKLGLMGVTVFSSSGDNGAPSEYSSDQYPYGCQVRHLPNKGHRKHDMNEHSCKHTSIYVNIQHA